MKNKWYQIVLGVILLPFVVLLYLSDRLICVPMVWIENKKILSWLKNDTDVFHSFIRVMIICSLIGLFKIIF